MLQHRVVLGDLDRVVGRDQRHRGAQDDALVSAAMCASSVVGDEETNGGLWCSPIANTSSPTSSARCAIAHDAVDALGLARRVAGGGSGAMSPT
jgi:hypothetical protein